MEDFRAVATYDKSVHDHRTGRKCAICGGVLLDSIINFGEALPEDALLKAFKNAKKADLCLALGSSLTVTPANEVPEVVGRSRRASLVICNLQSTPLDVLADIRIFSEADVLMAKVMEGLGFPIPSFILKRRLVVKHEMIQGNQHQFTLSGIDVDSTPVLFLQSVQMVGYRRVARSEPFSFAIRNSLDQGEQLEFALTFMGHYNEPNMSVKYEHPGEATCETTFDLKYDPYAGTWETTKL